jgi:hypothetical protein
MPSDWHRLSDQAQLAFTRAALVQAAEKLALQAETLAREMEAGCIRDHGGPDALRLFAAVVRVSAQHGFGTAGNA